MPRLTDHAFVHWNRLNSV